jgi:NCS1 family nucleobase:cation symporter-1
MSYIYGFIASALVYALLHKVFPSKAQADFANQPATSVEVRRLYEERWDVTLAETMDIINGVTVDKIDGIINKHDGADKV